MCCLSNLPEFVFLLEIHWLLAMQIGYALSHCGQTFVMFIFLHFSPQQLYKLRALIVTPFTETESRLQQEWLGK